MIIWSYIEKLRGNNMQNVLKDVIRYTHDLGEFEAFKVIVDKDGNAKIKSSSKDLSIIMDATLKNPIPELYNKTLDEDKKTTVGFSRLNVLAGYVNSPVFNDETQGNALTVTYKEASGSPDEIRFASDQGHRCTYRFMNPEAVKQKVKTFRLASGNEVEYDISFQPSEKFLKDFQSFATILSKFSNEFSFTIIDGVLYMNLGDDDTARFPVCETDCESINPMNTWPIKQVLSILKQAPSIENITFNILDETSMININIDTDYAVYSFHLSSL